MKSFRLLCASLNSIQVEFRLYLTPFLAAVVLFIMAPTNQAYAKTEVPLWCAPLHLPVQERISWGACSGLMAQSATTSLYSNVEFKSANCSRGSEKDGVASIKCSRQKRVASVVPDGNGGAEYLWGDWFSQTVDEGNFGYVVCHSGYSWNESVLDCVTYCPRGSVGFDPILKMCKQSDVIEEPKVCDPILAYSGESYQVQTPDYQGAGIFPLKFIRNYKSYRSKPKPSIRIEDHEKTEGLIMISQSTGYSPQAFSIVGINEPSIGATAGSVQWRHNYQLKLIAYPSGTKLTLFRANGDLLRFEQTSDELIFKPEELIGGVVEKTEANWVYTDPYGVKETYSLEGNLLKITDQQNLSQTLMYNSAGLLSKVTDPAGRSLTLSYDDHSRINAVNTPSNNTISYKYDEKGNLVQVAYPDNTSNDDTDNPKVIYKYENVDFPHMLTSQMDEKGDLFASWTFDAEGRATGSSNFDGHRAGSIVYEENATKVTETNGHVKTLNFDEKGRLSSVSGGCGTCGDSSSASYTYDSNNLLTSETDFNGNETRFEYNDRGLQVKRIEAHGTAVTKTTSTTWHDSLRLPLKIVTPSKQVEYDYGSSGQLKSITENDLVVTENEARVTSFSYNEKGLLASIDGPREDVEDITAYTYSENTDVAKVIDGAGNETAISTTNSNGFPTSITDSNGTVTTLTYDLRNRLTSQKVGENTTSFTYDLIGQLTSVTLPNGNKTSYEYSGARLLTKVLDASGNSISYTHDKMGNITKIEVKDTESNLISSQQQVFDKLNRVTKSVNGLGNNTLFTYDAVGNQVSTKSPLLNETKQVYDALNRLIKTTDAKNESTTYKYGSEDQITSVKAANSAETKYTYNGFGDLISQESPDTGKTTFSYDNAGNQVSKLDANNNETKFTYDVLNRLTKIDYAGDSADVTLTYDKGDNAKGKLTQMADESGSTTYSYNSQGLVSKKVSTLSMHEFAVSYDYDTAGLLKKITLPSGKVITLTRNSNGDVTEISEEKSGGSESLLTDASYVPFGESDSFILGNGSEISKSFNLAGLVTEIKAPEIYQAKYSYSNDSNITKIQTPLSPTLQQEYSYDELDRLTEAKGNYGDIVFGYDNVGNRLNKELGNQINPYTYKEKSNQIKQPYVHDANGNRVKDSKRSFLYGYNNRLSEVTDNESGLKTTYLYNGLGQRVQKSNIFGSVYYLYDEMGLLIAEADDSGSIVKEYVYFEGKPLAMLVGE